MKQYFNRIIDYFSANRHVLVRLDCNHYDNDPSTVNLAANMNLKVENVIAGESLI